MAVIKEGTITKLIYTDRATGFTIAIFETEDEQFTIKGTFLDAKEGADYRLSGDFVMHKKYGEQFDVKKSEVLIPNDADRIRSFLASGAIKGIGPKMADLLVDEFGDRTLDVIENSPEDILAAKIRGIGPKRLLMITESYRNKLGFNKISFALGDMGISTSQAVKIYQIYGDDAVEEVKRNPYALVETVYGISFNKADEIARSLGIPEDSDFRIQSGIAYVLMQFAMNGSTCMPLSMLVDNTIKLLDVTTEAVSDNILRMNIEGRLTVDRVDDVDVAYLHSYLVAEESVATRLAHIRNAETKPIPADVDNLIKLIINREYAGRNIQLSEEQKAAIKMALLSNLSIITGGPGTGKTTIINIIVKICEYLDFKVALAAPTGRAAKRITESSGFPAKTIHRMLEYIYSADEETLDFQRNEDNPLEEDVIIIDEASMIDIRLMEGLMKAIKPGTRLVIVGDADQLPSVGAGNVLRDMINSEFITTTRLRSIFRQAAESLIVANAHRINEGEYPASNEKNSDFFIMQRTREEEILETIKELFSGRLQNYYGFIESGYDIQVLTPTKKGLLGTVNLNTELQNVLNPPSPKTKERAHGSRIFREGDKVMQIRNNYNMEWRDLKTFYIGEGVFNGDMGIIDSIDEEMQEVIVRFDDRIVRYDSEDLNELELAYAVTVHKSQGSEFPAVVMPIAGFPPMLMTRNLLYTAVTRGKQLVVIVGLERRVNSMVDNNRIEARYTGLEYRLRRIDMGGGLAEMPMTLGEGQYDEQYSDGQYADSLYEEMYEELEGGPCN